MTGKKIIITVVVITCIAALVILGLQFISLKTQNAQQEEDLKAATELLEYERQQAERDLQSMAAEIDGYNMDIGNDSLISLIDEQKQKIQLLLQEIKTIKATNGRRIAELKDELSVVRKVLYDYIRQVDSLNRINASLRTENDEVKKKFNEVSQTASQLSKDKEQLTEVVSRAAMLEAENITIKTLNKRNKETIRLSKIQKIAISFSIAKNVTADAGYKTIYVRILKPSLEVLCKDKKHDTFKFEGVYIPYSVKKDIEYKGERLNETIYWDVNETLLTGEYKIDIFVDGKMVGNTIFNLKK